MADKAWLAPVILLLICGALYFPRLGHLPLRDYDEGFYASAAKEMLARHDYVTPYLDGRPLLLKPILVYWVTVLGFKLFGINEFGARIGSAISVTLLVLGTYLFGLRVANRRAGLIAALMLAGSYLMIDIGRVSLVDTVLAPPLAFGMMLAYLGTREDSRQARRSMLLAYPLFGLALLAKGPIPVGVALFGLFVYLCATGQLQQSIRRARIWPGLALMLVVAAPWYVLESLRHPQFLTVFFIREQMGHLEGGLARSAPVWGHVWNVLVYFFPWSLLLPAAYVHAARRWRKPGPDTFAAWWSLTTIAIFSIAVVKLPHYLAPAFPALAIMTAMWSDECLLGKSHELRSARATYAAVALLGALLAAALGMLLGPYRTLAMHLVNHWHLGALPFVTIGIMALGCLCGAWLALTRRHGAALASMMAMAFVSIILVRFGISWRVSMLIDEPRKELAQIAGRQLEPGALLAVSDAKTTAAVFYYPGRIVDLGMERPHAIRNFLRRRPTGAVIAVREEADELGISQEWHILATRGDCVLIGGRAGNRPTVAARSGSHPHRMDE